jgi:hypothetical protein
MDRAAARDHNPTLVLGRAAATCSVLTIPWRRDTGMTRGECARLR